MRRLLVLLSLAALALPLPPGARANPLDEAQDICFDETQTPPVNTGPCARAILGDDIVIEHQTWLVRVYVHCANPVPDGSIPSGIGSAARCLVELEYCSNRLPNYVGFDCVLYFVEQCGVGAEPAWCLQRVGDVLLP